MSGILGMATLHGGVFCLNGLTASVFIDGAYVGRATPYISPGETDNCPMTLHFTVSVNGLSQGTHTIAATFEGNSQYMPSSTGIVTQFSIT